MHHLIYHLCCLFFLYFKLELKGVVNVDVDVPLLLVCGTVKDEVMLFATGI